MSSQELRIGEKVPKVQRKSGIERISVRDDSGNYAAFTEQGASASHITAAKVLDVISRLPGCSGQASDAASAHTQVEMKDVPVFGQSSGRRLSKELGHITENKETTTLGLSCVCSLCSWNHLRFDDYVLVVFLRT